MFRKILLVISVSLLFASAVIAQGTSTAAAPAATPTAEKKPVFRSTKAQVIEAQTMLKTKKMFDGEATGTSSTAWKNAVKAYQSENGLAKTGSLNRATLEKMEIKLTDKQAEIPVDPKHLATENETKSSKSGKKNESVDLKLEKVVKIEPGSAVTLPSLKKPAPFRANADQIKAAQKMLKDGKMYTGEETGKLDDATREGLGKYQEANKVKVTKTLNAATLEKMGIALTDAQKANVAAQAAYDASKASKN